MNNELLLLSKNDIPFPEAQVNIHQPTIREISLIGEENFLSGYKLICFSKNNLSPEDKRGLEDKSDFEIFMSIMNSQERIQYKNSVRMLLALILPDYEINLTENDIICVNKNAMSRINDINFNVFKDILNAMFSLDDVDDNNKNYNPANRRAEKIAEKLRERREKVAKAKGENSKVAVFSRYVSILAVGLKKDINTLMDYTVYQLKDEFKRYTLKQSFDMYVQQKLAGAQDLDEVDNWMEDIHS